MLHLLGLLLPALFPSWRFFKTIAPSPRIEFRLGTADWVALQVRPQTVSLAQMTWRLLWNPTWNEQLFLVSCAERLVTEPTPFVAAEIHRRVARLTAAPIGAMLSFRLVFVSWEGGAMVKTIEFEGPPLQVAPP